VAGCQQTSNLIGSTPMSEGKAFFDTNVLLYMLSADVAKADRSEELIALGATVSIQVLNEFVAVTSRKLRMPSSEIRDVLSQIRAVCAIEPITIATHEKPYTSQSAMDCRSTMP
jgi:predicted nucleic acid-binding protein